MFHVIGIMRNHKVQQLCCRATLEAALDAALQYASEYTQLFLVQPNFNVRELLYTAPENPKGKLELGQFQPKIGSDCL